jgi:hypothetical protein
MCGLAAIEISLFHARPTDPLIAAADAVHKAARLGRDPARSRTPRGR